MTDGELAAVALRCTGRGPTRCASLKQSAFMQQHTTRSYTIRIREDRSFWGFSGCNFRTMVKERRVENHFAFGSTQGALVGPVGEEERGGGGTFYQSI